MMTILTGNHGNQILRELLLKFSGKFIYYSGSISDRLVQASSVEQGSCEGLVF